ncbi:MAG TPA: helix-turn-helix domain-containing protein [Solimonas sp.]|nr:helix-turn-helix domain-containing protein [Solimonas sp.]
MPRKPASEQFDTLQAIQDCAFELFGRFGYEGVSIGDIAGGARLSKGALYWHFDGKDQLYLHCLKRLHALFDQYIFDPMRVEKDSVKAILLMFTGLARLVEDPRVEQGIAGYWHIPSTEETAQIISTQRGFESRSVATLAEVLRLGKQQGQIDMGGDLDDLARAIILLIEAVVLPLRHQSAEEVHRMLGVLARTLFRAYAKSDELVKLARAI